MRKILSQQLALKIMIAILIMVLLFHVSILIQVIPYTIVWAGKIDNIKEMQVFETISILVNGFMILVFLLKGNYIRNNLPEKLLNGIIWILAILFSLNTIGNLFAKTPFELYFFTPLTFILAMLSLRIVMEKKVNQVV